MAFLFKNLALLDPRWKEARGGYEVLVEGVSKNADDAYAGRTDGFKLVNFTSDKSPDEIIGTMVNVEITESKTFSLEGREVR